MNPMEHSEIRSFDRLLSAQEVADYLRVPLATIYTWRHRHQGPPGLRVGRHLRYRRRDVEAWIELQMKEQR